MNVAGLTGLLAVMIPIVAIVMHNLTKMREARARGMSDETASVLLQRAERLDERVAMLERILDAESPGWRSRV